MSDLSGFRYASSQPRGSGSVSGSPQTSNQKPRPFGAPPPKFGKTPTDPFADTEPSADSGPRGLPTPEASPERRDKHRDSNAESETDEHTEGETESSQNDIASPSTLMPGNPFESEQSKIQFAAIDKLKSGNSHKFIEIPQLIIAGDQSTGKSSLLQRLTGIPFPVNHACCTRFPTRIVSQRTDPGTSDSFCITIDAPEVHVDGLAASQSASPLGEYRRTGVNLTSEIFEEVISEVSENYMDIRPGKGRGTKNFACEVLRVELSGPNRSYFSITDLPGTFQSASNVNESDRRIVVDLIAAYMREMSNIVICVADAPTHPERQLIFDLAAANSATNRCVGVFTKCDMINDDPGMKQLIVDHAKSTSDIKKVLEIPYFLVRNRTPSDSSSTDLDSAENELFGSASWGRVPSEKLGTAALRSFLARRLDAEIQAVFPKIRSDLRRQLEGKIADLDILGEPRKDLKARVDYVAKVAQQYHTAAMVALRHPSLNSDPSTRLRGKAESLKTEFDVFMRHRGMEWEFENLSDKQEDDTTHYYDTVAGKEAGAKASQANNGTNQWTGPFQKYANVKPLVELQREINVELELCSGTLLPGITDPVVYRGMYRRQVQKWPSIAETHLECVAAAVKSFFHAVFETEFPHDALTPALRAGLLDRLNRSFDKTYAEARKLCKMYGEAEAECVRMETTDPQFVRSLTLSRFGRFWRGQMMAEALVHKIDDAETKLRCFFEHMHPSLHQNMVQDIHDVIKAYYEITLRAFIRNINTMVIEAFMANPEGPINGLSGDRVRLLPTDELDDLGREDEHTERRREELTRDIANLREGLKIVDDASQQVLQVRH